MNSMQTKTRKPTLHLLSTVLAAGISFSCVAQEEKITFDLPVDKVQVEQTGIRKVCDKGVRISVQRQIEGTPILNIKCQHNRTFMTVFSLEANEAAYSFIDRSPIFKNVDIQLSGLSDNEYSLSYSVNTAPSGFTPNRVVSDILKVIELFSHSMLDRESEGRNTHQSQWDALQRKQEK